jgi:hypothetical protein
MRKKSFRPSSVLRDQGYEHMGRNDPYTGGFEVVTSSVNINSSFDTRPYEEIHIPGAYEYYRNNQNVQKYDKFQRDFESFVESSNTAL